MKYISVEVTLAAIFLASLFVLLNPWHIFMPTYVVMMLEATLLVVFAAFLIFVWRETGGDEREERHREFSDRLAFLVGAGICWHGGSGRMAAQPQSLGAIYIGGNVIAKNGRFCLPRDPAAGGTGSSLSVPFPQK